MRHVTESRIDEHGKGRERGAATNETSAQVQRVQQGRREACIRKRSNLGEMLLESRHSVYTRISKWRDEDVPPPLQRATASRVEKEGTPGRRAAWCCNTNPLSAGRLPKVCQGWEKYSLVSSVAKRPLLPRQLRAYRFATDCHLIKCLRFESPIGHLFLVTAAGKACGHKFLSTFLYAQVEEMADQLRISKWKPDVIAEEPARSSSSGFYGN